MKLRGVEFAPAWNAAGARNFFGEGWAYHRYLGPFRPRFDGATFVAKTTTVEPRAGNMRLHGTTPAELLPRCIRVNFRKAAVLNAVGLSGPGLEALLADGRWQSRLIPFFLSFMAVEADPAQRLRRAHEFGTLLAAARKRFLAPFGLQVNFSCPNVGHATQVDIVAQVLATLDVLSRLLPDAPLVPKFNVLVPHEAVREIGKHKACDAVCVSNTIPWGEFPGRIDWEGLFGEVSPLAGFGGGGLSGAPITGVVRSWFYNACRLKLPVPLIGGGGVVHRDNAMELLACGAKAVEVGSVAIVRPWRVAGIVKTINTYEERYRGIPDQEAV